MPKKPSHCQAPSPATLRRQAEERWKASCANRPPPAPQDLPSLVYELEVHQIELEIQNEELRRSQVELAKARDSYLDLYDFAPVGYLMLDTHRIIRQANLTAARLLGKERGKLVGKRLEQYVGVETRDAFYLHLQAALASPTTPACSLVLLRPDGSEFYATLKATCIDPPREDAFRYRVVLTDTTVLHRAEQLQRESEERYRALFEQAADAVLVIDPQTLGVRDFNDEACQRLGYTREEFAKLRISDFEFIESAAQTARHCQEILANGADIFETKQRTRDGAVLDIEVRAKAVHLGGELLIQGIWRDITERKRVDQERCDREEWFRALTENAADLVSVIDANGILRYESPSGERSLGYAPGELVGRDAFELVRPEDRDAVRAVLQELLLQPGASQRMEFWLRARDGRYRMADVIGHNLLDNAAVRGIVLNCRDITDRKQIEETLHENEAKLRAAFDNAPFEFWVRDTDGRCTMQNAAAAKHWGNRIGKCVEEHDIPADIAALWQANNRRALAGEIVEHEVEYLCDAELRVYHTIIAPFQVDGAVRGILGFNIDITERKRAEVALQNAARQWQATFDAVGEAVLLLDAQQHICRSNRAAQVLFGKAAVEMHGHLCCEIVHGTATPMPDCPFRRVQDSLLRETTQLAIGERFFRVTIDPVLDAEGKLAGAVHILSDITAQRLAERDLQLLNATLENRVMERTEALRMLHDVASMANRAKNLRQAVEYCLQRLTTYNGWDFGHAFLPAADGNQLTPAYAYYHHGRQRFAAFRELTWRSRFGREQGLPGRVLASRKVEWAREFCRDLRDPRAAAAGELGINTAIAFPVLAGQTVVAVLEFFSDTAIDPDERVVDAMASVGIQLGRVIERADFQEHLLQVAEQIQQFIAQDLHDDIGQELTGLGLKAETLTEMLNSSAAPLAAGKLATDIVTAIERTRGKVRGLSRGLVPAELEEGLLANAISQLVNTTMSGSRIACTFECSYRQPVRNASVALHLYRIVQEAISNAVRHSGAGNVKILLQPAGEGLVIGIEDDGCGMTGQPLRGGMGLQTMRYRADLIGAQLEIGVSPSGGTQVICRWEPPICGPKT